MIIERRRKVRINKTGEIDWVSDFNCYDLDDWEDESICKIDPTPWQAILGTAIIAGLSAFALGSFLF